ncbi:hypothetical protein C8E97_6765 [Saccharothrix australiensis]|uniref:Uncharacterized protein n=1 Tax=Saccharothrix australiensis TaxID=2072 RepID=A0A495VIR4_9PSEU|nr:hypothetical protein C8E97_6765 [Saccharothrix australiensis]
MRAAQQEQTAELLAALDGRLPDLLDEAVLAEELARRGVGGASVEQVREAVREVLRRGVEVVCPRDRTRSRPDAAAGHRAAARRGPGGARRRGVRAGHGGAITAEQSGALQAVLTTTAALGAAVTSALAALGVARRGEPLVTPMHDPRDDAGRRLVPVDAGTDGGRSAP